MIMVFLRHWSNKNIINITSLMKYCSCFISISLTQKYKPKFLLLSFEKLSNDKLLEINF